MDIDPARTLQFRPRRGAEKCNVLVGSSLRERRNKENIRLMNNKGTSRWDDGHERPSTEVTGDR